MEPGQIAVGLIWYVVLLFSLTVHEAGHAWAAARGGDLTAYLGGQVSLDPRPHMRRELFGTVLVPLFSFAMSGWMIGWASTPYDPRWAYAHPRRAGWMSLAGPAANLALVVLAGVGIRLAMLADVVEPGHPSFTALVVGTGSGVAEATGMFLSLLFMMNLLLLVFNLIPVPPLDGSGALSLLVSEDTARRMKQWMARPAFALLGILAAWIAIPVIFWPVCEVMLGLLFPEYL
ncbi:MAG: site-2 protease family protein [Myxococcota bacterium]|nr:hypothetical protein [Deltaproteobacteria bacterium]MCP4239375.1 site-2 protease family protein [bacterium]MDP6075636.1 site-2 protease family protein [Myxococcota bacterium]MDP6242978.1 site-2 protease family protein [Myxococcota bacterium]MDP7075380.1 site-2 protease family protein [Myxococcota bacterium]